MVVKIAQKVLRQETGSLGGGDLQVEAVLDNNPPRAFLETFGSWEDTRTTEEIIDDIYASRTLPNGKDSL